MTTAKDKYQEFFLRPFFYVLLFHNCFQFCSLIFNPWCHSPLNSKAFPLWASRASTRGGTEFADSWSARLSGPTARSCGERGPRSLPDEGLLTVHPTPGMMFCRHEPVSYSVSHPLAGSALNCFAFQEQGILTGQERGHPFFWGTQRQRFRSQLHNISGIFYLNKSN